MSNTRYLTAVAAVLTFLLFSTAGVAAEPADTKRDFSTLACKDILRLSGADRDIALAFAHGYMLGKKDTTQYDVDALAQVTDQFIDYCLDHPAENALQSFEKLAK